MDVVLSGLSPDLVWGLMPRLIGAIYIMAFASIAGQVVPLAGSQGWIWHRRLLQCAQRDMPGIRRFFEYPSVLWFIHGDKALKLIPLVGMLCGAAAIYGGPIGFAGLLLGWVLWLSLEHIGLIFPWDTMLQEVGFLALFLPLVPTLPHVHATVLPLPSVAFMMRWLPLRLIFGFGKDKFIGTRRDDVLYLRGFFVWMPMPNKLAWWGHHAPAWFLKAALTFMFFAEVISPILGLFSGGLRLVSFGGLVFLSIGIFATGNWGFFNLGFVLLCVSLLDVNASIFDLGSAPYSQTWSHWPDVGVHAVMAALFLISIFYLPNDSWFTRSWVNWPVDFFSWDSPFWKRMFVRLHKSVEILRWIAPFRIVNGYGVFPPNAAAPMRRVPVIEGSDDGVEWKQYGYKYIASFAKQPPRQLAPHQPRLDMAVYYYAAGIHQAGLLGNALPQGSPYLTYARATIFDTIMQRIMSGDPKPLEWLGHNPFPDKPPRYMRLAVVALVPRRPSELRRTGEWWHVQRLGLISLPRGPESWVSELMTPHPETFHPDFTAPKRRAAPLRAMLEAYRSGAELDRAVIAGSELSEADVRGFWDDFLPLATREHGDWSQIHTRAEQLQERFGIGGLYKFERILERYVWILHERIAGDPAAAAAADALNVTHSRYHFILHTVMLGGRKALLELLAAPSGVTGLAQRASDGTQLWMLTLLRYEPVMALVCSFRWSDAGELFHTLRVPGLAEYFPFLVKLRAPSEVFRPRWVKHPDGEFTIDGMYPPPARSSAPSALSVGGG